MQSTAKYKHLRMTDNPDSFYSKLFLGFFSLDVRLGLGIHFFFFFKPQAVTDVQDYSAKTHGDARNEALKGDDESKLLPDAP